MPHTDLWLLYTLPTRLMLHSDPVIGQLTTVHTAADAAQRTDQLNLPCVAERYRNAYD